jgi:hypothetical protein
MATSAALSQDNRLEIIVGILKDKALEVAKDWVVNKKFDPTSLNPKEIIKDYIKEVLKQTAAEVAKRGLGEIGVDEKTIDLLFDLGEIVVDALSANPFVTAYYMGKAGGELFDSLKWLNDIAQNDPGFPWRSPGENFDKHVAGDLLEKMKEPLDRFRDGAGLEGLFDDLVTVDPLGPAGTPRIDRPSLTPGNTGGQGNDTPSGSGGSSTSETSDPTPYVDPPGGADDSGADDGPDTDSGDDGDLFPDDSGSNGSDPDGGNDPEGGGDPDDFDPEDGDDPDEFDPGDGDDPDDGAGTDGAGDGEGDGDDDPDWEGWYDPATGEFVEEDDDGDSGGGGVDLNQQYDEDEILNDDEENDGSGSGSSGDDGSDDDTSDDDTSDDDTSDDDTSDDDTSDDDTSDDDTSDDDTSDDDEGDNGGRPNPNDDMVFPRISEEEARQLLDELRETQLAKLTYPADPDAPPRPDEVALRLMMEEMAKLGLDIVSYPRPDDDGSTSINGGQLGPIPFSGLPDPPPEP